MTKEPEFKRGEKGYLKRFINIFQSDAEIVLDDFKSKASESISEVNEFKSELTTEINSLRENITLLEEKEQTLKNKLDEISNFGSSIFEEDDEGVVLSEQIESFVEEFKEYKKEIEDLKQEIDEYKNELFGTEDDEGNEVLGLNHKIESLKSQLQIIIKESQNKLDEFLIDNNKKQDELFNKIEGLLKGASTVALAKSFNDHKKSFNITNYIWMGSFILSILSMMALSVWGFINAHYDFKDMWKYTLGNLPFIGGAIWIAIYSSKQRSQNKRLQQEYAFKEDVAKIYYGLKQEIEELGRSEIGEKLNLKMLETIISVVEDNPSKTLDNKSHNDKGPILEGLNSIAELVKNIKNPI